MIKRTAFAILLMAMVAFGQTNPALVPKKAPKPALPKVDEKACPFEGCQFGQWKAIERIPVYSSWKEDRKLLVTLSKGETVTSITGVNITFEPAEFEVTAPMPQYGLKPGDKVFGYMNLGEGFFNAWYNGYWEENFDGSGVHYDDDSGCTRNCTMKVLKPGRIEWWVKVKTKSGVIGWTKDTKFEGMDSLGAGS